MSTAQSTAIETVPENIGSQEIDAMTDEQYQQLPLSDPNEAKTRENLLQTYREGGSGYPLSVNIDSIDPKGGPSSGSTRVTVRGGPFKDMWLIHPHPKCKFGRNDMIVSATYVTCSPKPAGATDPEATKAEKVSFNFA